MKSSVVTFALYNLNRIGDEQHLYLNSLLIFTLLVSPWSIRTLKYDKLWGII